MANQFVVQYNGHPVSITALESDRFLAQVTYKPVTIQLHRDSEGLESWVEAETQQQTYVTKELGELIKKQLNPTNL